MFTKNKSLIFLPCLFIGTMIAISSSSWVSAWIGLEINLMSMAPILMNINNPKSIEATIKYFLFQALASMLIIFFVFSVTLMNPSSFNSFSLISLMATTCLIFKIGMAPFQFWLPQVMACVTWTNCFILLSWQKIAPMVLLSFSLSTNPSFLLSMSSVILSAMIGCFGGINQPNLKILISYSSIIHSSWLLTLILANSTFWMMYFVIYCVITLSFLYPLFKISISSINLLHMIKLAPLSKSLLLMNFLSLAGLPPLLGFSTKLVSIFILFKMNYSSAILAILIISSLISFYFYLRLTFSFLFNLNWNLSSHFLNNLKSPMFTLSTNLSLLGSFTLSYFSLLT